MVRSDLAAEFNQISVVNILVQLYSGILAFVLYSSVVDQSALAYLSTQACQVCTTQRDAAGAPHSRLQRWEHTLARLVWSSSLTAKKKNSIQSQHTHKYTDSPPDAARNILPFRLVSFSTKQTFLHPSAKRPSSSIARLFIDL